ncbi:hypothetical protein BD560DRAFT_403716 [Blakeslea trispora]|nr:hypothetical protein BD560DRAFT_418908 [Blakeslea trispora]KAI8364127.1 hypothetical protein BD560DRAFT_403716 [Blakeslea trispora]
MSQQQIENNNDLLLRSIESGSTNRLPLRKRIAPVLKWQPVETPEEHHKQTYPLTSILQTASPYPVHSISDASDNSIESDETKRKEEHSPSPSNSNRPTKKVKRGRPPLQRNQQSESTISNTPGTPNNTSLYPLPPPPTNDKVTKPDKNALYCICKSPYDGTRFMIACDKCDQWFHGECIGISEKQGEFIDLYFCEDCAQMTGKRTIWKPKCANPNCTNAARIGTNQGHLSKYCADGCGMQVARARVELAEMKKKNSEEANNLSLSEHQYNPLSRSKLSSYADLDDRSRLSRVKEEKLQAKQVIGIGQKKLALLSFSIQANKDQEICGFDSRLVWPESVWEKVEEVRSDKLIDSRQQPLTKSYSICQSSKKCNRHLNWQKIKAFELEQERSEQFVILTMLERERQQIQARMRKRREEVDLVQFLDNGTLHHF